MTAPRLFNGTFAASLVCDSCRAFFEGTDSPEGHVRPTEKPHAVLQSSHGFWHRGRDEDRDVTWPCKAWRIWEYLATIAAPPMDQEADRAHETMLDAMRATVRRLEAENAAQAEMLAGFGAGNLKLLAENEELRVAVDVAEADVRNAQERLSAACASRRGAARKTCGCAHLPGGNHRARCPYYVRPKKAK